MHDPRRGFDAHRVLVDYALDWDVLCDLADRIYHDRRLSWPEKDRLFSIVDVRERALGGTAVRCLQAASSKGLPANT